MDMALETLSKEELIALLKEQDASISYLKSQVELLKRMQFGQKRERFEGDPAQGVLPFATPPEQQARQEEEIKEQITYTRKKQAAHQGRVALPSHLPVEEIEIHPQGDLSAMVCIGKEVTEELECEPARLFIRRYIRYKYAPCNGQGVNIGDFLSG